MKRIIVLFLLVIFSCQHKAMLRNSTRPGGYAMGESVGLVFSLNKISNPPDSIEVWVVEKKTGFVYSLRAGLTAGDSLYHYSCRWDGRKADGRWPMGGHYLVYGIMDLKQPVFSDTVEIGLTD